MHHLKSRIENMANLVVQISAVLLLICGHIVCGRNFLN